MIDIVVALGGGGAKGNAHIGVLRQLEAQGFRIRAVAGTSAGGLVGALYAAGHTPDEIEDLYTEIDQNKLYGRRPNEGPSLLGLMGVEKWLDEVIGERVFDELKIPCAVTAVDLKDACEVTLQTGQVKSALLSTIAVPGIFPPYAHGEHIFIDGGVLNPVPVSVVRTLKPKLPIIAVSLSPRVGPVATYHLPIPDMIPSTIVKRISQNRVTQAFNIFLQSVDISSRMLTELRLQADKPDFIIRPAVDDIGLLDRVDVHEIARRGDQAVLDARNELLDTLSWPARVKRRFWGAKSK
ncbi:MAG: patatin-like phospholipase family protein [Anaerolineales bacterium]|nr:patatin-like phospholipase family protein [Anaerolineales bacterium]